MNTTDTYLTVRQICETYHVTPAAVSKWVKANRLPHTRLGTRVLIPVSGLESFLADSAARYTSGAARLDPAIPAAIVNTDHQRADQ